MDFAMVAAYQPTDQLVPLAQAAEEAGFRAFSLADHVVDLEEVATPYPYTADGRRRWEPDVDWPDPWVAVGALAQVATRLQFFTSIYVAVARRLSALRAEAERADEPFEVAPALTDALTPDDFARAAEGGVTLCMTMPWMYYCRQDAPLQEKLDGIHRFREDVIDKL